ncbi:MAG: M20/M25/M40 family metallo-hydrolase [Alphaproteobacteria bacterium]|nr:M20/M25/M40 family metallo-hydrolase [Alphaproteobacteria bacterium]
MQDSDNTTAPPRNFPAGALALGVMALLFIAFFFRAVPLQLDPVRATNTPSQFDTERAVSRLARILDGKPHPVDSDANDATRARLLDEIRKLGYDPQVHDETACRGSITGSVTRCARVQSITFTAGPTSGPVLMLTAHYDSVPAGPGAADDGIGLAVWLEVAQHLKETPPQKPVLFLLTDGEEAALLGAQAFADKKAYGYTIGRIINLEARGNTGPAAMFETSHPNQGVVSDWSKGAPRPSSNSMMTAAYELLPNSTDLTVHLQQGLAGINIAVADGQSFYHTPHDDLAHLDHRAVQHMGDQALGATRAFLASDDKPGGEIAYSDIIMRGFVMLPQQISLILLGLCAGLAALLNFSPASDISWRQFSWRAFAAPPVTVLGATLIAMASAFLFGLIRSQPDFWRAHPQALGCTIFICALIAAALVLTFLIREERREQLFAAGWFWLLVIGMGLSITVPGMSIIFLLPGLGFVLVAIVARFLPKYALAAHALAGVWLLLIFLPLIYLVDVMMGLNLPALSIGAVFAVLEGLVLGPFLGLIGPIRAGRRLVFPALGGAWVLGAFLTLIFPAWSAARPTAFDIAAHYDMDTHKAELVAASKPGFLPKAIRDQLNEPPAEIIPGIDAKLAHHALAFADRPSASAAIESDTTDGDVRTLTLRLSAPGAQQVRLRIPEQAQPRTLRLEGAPESAKLNKPMRGFYIFDCVGRACDGAAVTLTLAVPAQANPPDHVEPWTVQGYWAGLPAEGERIAALRTDATLPIQSGDQTITTKRLTP